MKDIRDIAQITGEALKQEGAEKAQYTVTFKETHEFNVDGGQFSLFRTLFDKSLSVTAFKNQKKGSAFTNKLDEETIGVTVKECLDSAESGIADSAYDIAPCQGEECFREGCYEPDADKLFARTKELMEAVKERNPKIVMEQMIVSHVKNHTLYRNTNGTEFEYFWGEYSVDMMYSAHEGEKMTSFFGSSVTMDNLDTPFIELGSLEKDLCDVEAQLTTVPMEGKFEGVAVLAPSSLVSFVASAINNFVSDSVILEKTSIWLDKLNTKVADEKITVSMAPTDSRICCSERFTGDGFKSENYNLIEDGVLKSFMLSLYVANKSGFARAKNSSFALIMKNGDTPYADMIKNIKKGIIVGRFSGGNPGPNGDFSGIAKNSFLIEDGEIKGAVSETMINGNLAEMLQNVVAVSKETIAGGNCVLPYVAVDKIVISGK